MGADRQNKKRREDLISRRRRRFGGLYTRAHRRKPYEEATVAAKFTRIPKTTELIQARVPTEAIPTYCALADHANNKTGLCWPKMETLAKCP